jgi:hypothetical protein
MDKSFKTLWPGYPGWAISAANGIGRGLPGADDHKSLQTHNLVVGSVF